LLLSLLALLVVPEAGWAKNPRWDFDRWNDPEGWTTAPRSNCLPGPGGLSRIRLSRGLDKRAVFG